MTDYTDKKYSELSHPEKIREAEKMIEAGAPIELICRIFKIPVDQLQHLRQQGNANFK